MDIEKYLLVDIFDAYVYDCDTDKLIFMSENLTSSDITGKADETKVTNGKGNALFAKLYSNKEVDLSLKTNAFSFDTLALLCGTSVGTGRGTYYAEAQNITIKDGGFTLFEAPKYPQKVEAYIGDEKITLAFNESDKTIVEVDSDYEGKTTKVMPYEYDSEDTDIKEIIVRADEFPSACKVVLKSYVKTKKSKVWKNLTITIPQASLASDFNLSTSSEVKPVETEIKMSALSNNGELMKISLTPLTKNKETVKLVGDIEFTTKTFTTVAKDSDGVGNPPYVLQKVNYVRTGDLAKVEFIAKDKDTEEVFYHETNTTNLTEGVGSFTWSRHKGLTNYDVMTQEEKDLVERNDNNIIKAGVEYEIEIKMTDENGNEKSIIQNYVMTKKDVTDSKYTA